MTRQILFGLVDANPQNSPVIVGQHVFLTANYGPAILFPKVPKIAWRITGKTVQEYVQTKYRTYIQYLPVQPTGTELSYYYLDGSVTGEADSATAAMRTTTGEIKKYELAITVFKPALSAHVTIMDDPINFDFANIEVGGKRHKISVLSFGIFISTKNGMAVEGEVTPPAFSYASGVIALLQLTSSTTIEKNPQTTTTWQSNGFEVDNKVPYSDTFSVHAGLPTHLGADDITWTDDPSVPLADSNFVSFNADFKDYVMYKPSGLDSIYVALGQDTWGFSMAASRSEDSLTRDPDAMNQKMWTLAEQNSYYPDNTSHNTSSFATSNIAPPEWKENIAYLKPTIKQN